MGMCLTARKKSQLYDYRGRDIYVRSILWKEDIKILSLYKESNGIHFGYKSCLPYKKQQVWDLYCSSTTNI